MIWIGTSGWEYPHWKGRFYPKGLPVREHLPYYARHFPTVEFNRSFYRLPTREQFESLREQTCSHPNFWFAVKASRYLTHMKKLLDPAEPMKRLVNAAEGLGDKLGPFLYQLPPRWHANPARLEEFIHYLPANHPAAFEFRDPSWFEPDTFRELTRILSNGENRTNGPKGSSTLAVAVGGALPTPLNLPTIGPFDYIRFHSGAGGIGLSEDELAFWAQRLASAAEKGREVYAYFNNDPEGYAILNALRLRELLGPLAVAPT